MKILSSSSARIRGR